VSERSQFRLFGERRFAPFFGAQLLGAFNDNLYKNALVILVTYQAASWTRMDPVLLANLAAGLFILPFVLFSALAGQLADRFDKAALIRAIKFAEIPIMAVAGIGFARGDVGLLLFALFLMGTQSAFFGPVKYAILPQVLRENELVGGNGLVETGTFLAILAGTLCAGLMASTGDRTLILATVMSIAVLGFAASLWVPATAASSPGLRLDWNPLRATLANVRFARANRAVFLSILGISWFWAYGAIVIAQLPALSKLVLGGDERVVTALLAVFSIGVGAGSLLCERLSGHKVEIGLVPFGSIGLSLFALDLYLVTNGFAAGQALAPLDLLAQPGGWRVYADLLLIGLFGGFYIVPLYALVQLHSKAQERSRIISANNILNALFMVAAALFAAVALGNGLTLPQLLLVVAVMNAAVALFIYARVPEFLLRFLSWLLVHSLFRLRVRGAANLPEEGAVLLVCNHVSYVDAMVVSAAFRRPVRFVMNHRIARLPVLSIVFRGMKTIPIASAKDDPELLERAYDAVAAALESGQPVCIFPEGRLTTDGELGPFRAGAVRIVERTPVNVVPMALSGLWDSAFSMQPAPWWRRWRRGMLARVDLRVGAALPPESATPETLRAAVSALLGAQR
jgi:1-acyl-sn-glycerol-3-phosphate acyltransferase